MKRVLCPAPRGSFLGFLCQQDLIKTIRTRTVYDDDEYGNLDGAHAVTRAP